MISCLQYSFVAAVNSNKLVPRYVLVILDADLISHLHYSDEGTTGMLVTWVEWIAKEFSALLKTWKDKLPPKVKKKEEDPCIYWVQAPLHQGFS